MKRLKEVGRRWVMMVGVMVDMKLAARRRRWRVVRLSLRGQ